MSEMNQADQAAGGVFNSVISTVDISDVLAELFDNETIGHSISDGDAGDLGSLSASFGIVDSFRLYQQAQGYRGSESSESNTSHVRRENGDLMALYDIRDSLSLQSPGLRRNQGIGDSISLDNIGSSLMSLGNDSISISFGITDSLQLHDQVRNRRRFSGVSIASEGLEDSVLLHRQGGNPRRHSASSRSTMSVGSDSFNLSFGIKDSLSLHDQVRNRRRFSGLSIASQGLDGRVMLHRQGDSRQRSSVSSSSAMSAGIDSISISFGIKDSLELHNQVSGFRRLSGSSIASQSHWRDSFGSYGSSIFQVAPTKMPAVDREFSLGAESFTQLNEVSSLTISGFEDSSYSLNRARVGTIAEENQNAVEEESQDSNSESESMDEDDEQTSGRKGLKRTRSRRLKKKKSDRKLEIHDVNFD